MDFVKVYGPMSLGWVGVFFLWKENQKITSWFYEEKIKDVEAKVNQAQTLSQLIDLVKDKLK